MELKRLRPAEWLALAAGVALLASLFLPWYGVAVDVGATGFELSRGFTAWQSFQVIDLVLAALALVALALPALQATRNSPAAPVGAAVVAVTAGAVGAGIAAYRLLDQPGPDEFITLHAGAWVGMAAAAAVPVAGWLALRDDRAPGQTLPVGVELRRAPPA